MTLASSANKGRRVDSCRLLRGIVGVMLVGVLFTGNPMGAAGKRELEETGPAASAKPELIWPLPPDSPRVRWLTEYTDMARVRKPEAKRRGWLDKVTGAKASHERGIELGKPFGVTTDSRGRIFVADGGLRVIFVIDPAARTTGRIEGSSRAPILLPVGLAIDSQDRLFVSDAQLHSITCFGPEGEEVARFGAESLGRPGGIAVDRKRNRLYVADAKEGRIAVFDLNKFSLMGYFGSPSKQGHVVSDNEKICFRSFARSKVMQCECIPRCVIAKLGPRLEFQRYPVFEAGPFAIHSFSLPPRLANRISPLQAGEAGEVGIGGAQLAVVFYRKCSQVSI
jgi:hypothetical protein